MLDKTLIENLKKVDPDRYRAAMFAPIVQREALLTLYAFHAELAKVPEMVSEPMIGAIRYQWWRDALEEIYTGKAVRKHEVAIPLAGMIETYDIPRYWLDRLIDGRERDLDPTPFTNLDEAKQYCGNTSGVLMQLAAHSLAKDSHADEIGQLGAAWGLTGLARSWKYYKGSMLSGLSFEELLTAAGDQYSPSAKALKSAGSDIMPAIAYGALIPPYIKKMSQTDYDPAVQTPEYGPLAKQLRLMGTILKGKV